MHKRNLMPYEIYLGQSPSIDRLFVCYLQTTVRKFHDFPITQILLEINFGEYRSCKTADFALFLHNVEIS